MKSLTKDEMKAVTGGKTYYAKWSCPYCSMKGEKSGSSKAIAKAKADYQKALHLHNVHNK